MAQQIAISFLVSLGVTATAAFIGVHVLKNMAETKKKEVIESIIEKLRSI